MAEKKLSKAAQKVRDVIPDFDPLDHPDFDDEGELDVEPFAFPDGLDPEEFDPETDQDAVDSMAEKLRAILKKKRDEKMAKSESALQAEADEPDFGRLDSLIGKRR